MDEQIESLNIGEIKTLFYDGYVACVELDESDAVVVSFNQFVLFTINLLSTAKKPYILIDEEEFLKSVQHLSWDETLRVEINEEGNYFIILK